MLAGLMRQHLAGGGMIVAATHGPLGIEAKELRLGADRVSPLSALMLRDMRLAIRVGGGALMGVLFFLIVVTLVPFAVGPDLAQLRRIGPAILWLGALLASLLTLDRLFAADQEDGSLDLLLMGTTPLELSVLAKAAAHWITTALPLVIAAPLLGLFLNLEPLAIGAVALTLLAGTPALTGIGLIGAALSVALRRGGLLLPRARAAADRAGADLRRRRLERGRGRARDLRRAVHDPVRAVARQPRDRAVRGRGGAASPRMKARTMLNAAPHCGHLRAC